MLKNNAERFGLNCIRRSVYPEGWRASGEHPVWKSMKTDSASQSTKANLVAKKAQVDFFWVISIYFVYEIVVSHINPFREFQVDFLMTWSPFNRIGVRSASPFLKKKRIFHQPCESDRYSAICIFHFSCGLCSLFSFLSLAVVEGFSTGSSDSYEKKKGIQSKSVSARPRLPDRRRTPSWRTKHRKDWVLIPRTRIGKELIRSQKSHWFYHSLHVVCQ